jgi:hypothetical protein
MTYDTPAQLLRAVLVLARAVLCCWCRSGCTCRRWRKSCLRCRRATAAAAVTAAPPVRPQTKPTKPRSDASAATVHSRQPNTSSSPLVLPPPPPLLLLLLLCRCSCSCFLGAAAAAALLDTLLDTLLTTMSPVPETSLKNGHRRDGVCVCSRGATLSCGSASLLAAAAHSLLTTNGVSQSPRATSLKNGHRRDRTAFVFVLVVQRSVAALRRCLLLLHTPC